ncbi:hypothetical protein [Fodinicola acaciae]|uniref:hypothetical protein n=1 Tax=Fodinicola acaciae TaxID=2681555 RepID=UPI001C9E2EFF|nr:hypothetical protein [Fodinicola acaciae]
MGSSKPKATGSARNAVVAMYVGAGLTVAGAVAPIVDAATGDGLTRELASVYPGRTAFVEMAKTSILTYLFFISAVGVIGWLLLAWATRRGKGWARVASTVVFLLGSAILLYDFTQPHPALITVTEALPCLAGLAAVTFLWMRDSADFFRNAKTA